MPTRPPLESIELPGADLRFAPVWMPAHEADALFDTLRDAVPWECHRIRMFGRMVDSPRLSCWIGDPEAAYTYSRTRFAPHPWPDVLQAVRERLSEALDATFNSVLANRYRDGRDRMGWHSDDEPELGPRPLIASISLGAGRRFLLKTRDGGDAVGLTLPHGSLLVMAGETQSRYRHALPATARPVGERINLTFRRIVAGTSG